MAKKKRKSTKRVSRVRRVIPGTARKGFPTLDEIPVPEGGLLNPALRRDIGDVPGLAPTK